MSRLKRAALLTQVVKELRQEGSWTGETHLQKACYFLEELLGLPLKLDYILYKHGPFSFELRDELTALLADRILDLEPQAAPYGPRFNVSESGNKLLQKYPKTLGKYRAKTHFVATQLGNRGVGSLERLSTALYVTLRFGEDKSVEERTMKLHLLKPHISIEEAKKSIQEVDQITRQAESLGK